MLLQAGCALLLCLCCSFSVNGLLAADVQKEVLAQGLIIPTGARILPDDTRVLIVEQIGTLQIVNLATQTREAYMTITNVDSTGEKGLVDCVLDQSFATNGYFYCLFSAANPAALRISRFTHQENAGGSSSRGNVASEFVVWQAQQPYTGQDYTFGTVHYGGQLSWGPDGMLYATLGDETKREWVQQNQNELGDPRHNGCVLRVSKTGAIPSDNFGHQRGVPACWAYGLRNGYRSSWDIPSGRFFIGEVCICACFCVCVCVCVCACLCVRLSVCVRVSVCLSVSVSVSVPASPTPIPFFTPFPPTNYRYFFFQTCRRWGETSLLLTTTMRGRTFTC